MIFRLRFLKGVSWLALALLNAGPVQAVTKAMPVPSDNKVVDVTVESWLEHMPPTGLIPLTVSVHNHSTAPGQWRISAADQDYQNGTMQSSFTVAAPAGGMTRTSILLPVMPNYDSSSRSYKNVRLSVQGPGIAFPGFAGVLTAPSTGSGSSKPRTAFTVLSEGFDNQHGPRWKTAISREWIGDVVQMTDAPADWRGYSGIVQVWMLEREWTALSRPQREALLAWVAQGGAAFITTSSDTASLNWLDSSTPWNGAERSYGLGTVRAVSNVTAVAEAATLVNRSSELALEKTANDRVPSGYSLGSLLPPLRMNGTLIFAFILIFGVAVGPVNLFWLAAGAKRPRLFWTTPLISCIGTGVLIAVMILQDGFGGEGARVSLAIVLPEQKQMSVLQEQFAKTGILMSSSFDLPSGEQSWITPVPESHEVKSRFGSFNTHVDKRDYALHGSNASGGWYSSRAIQSHLINSQRMNRGGIELGGGDKPFIISSLNVPLKDCFLKDGQGRVWKSLSVPVGQRTVLTASSQEELARFIRASNTKNMSNLMRTRISRSRTLQNGNFFAEVNEPARIAVPSLNSIQWTQDRAYIAGACVPAAATNP